MGSQLTFDNAVIGVTAVATSAFVRGGAYNPELNISEVPTADGKLHQVPVYKGGSASCKLYGDQLALNSPVGLGGAVKLKNGSSEILSGTGLVSASYNESDNTTDIEIKIDPTTDSE
jgi:hypothetical protein